MLITSKLNLSKLSLYLLVIFLYSCGSPSNEEILLTNEKIKSLFTLPANCIEPIEFNDITVGIKQTAEVEEYEGTMAKNEWYPVRIKFTAKCLPDNSKLYQIGMPFETTDEAMAEWRAEVRGVINKDGVETTLTKHYRFQKNEYGEWEASDRRR